MTDLERLRNLIGDNYKTSVLRLISDGVSTIWDLGKTRVKEDSVTLSGDVGGVTISSVDYDEGLVTLSAAITEDAKFTFSFTFSAFSDSELEYYLSIGNVKSAALECINILMADAARRYSYSTGVEQFNASDLFKHLKELKESIKKDDIGLSSTGGASIKNRTTEYGTLDTLWKEGKPANSNNFNGI